MSRNTEAEVIRRINKISAGRLEYISGYSTKEAPIRVRCNVCGETFERTYHHLTTSGYGCPECLKRKKAKAKAETIAKKERTIQKKKAERFNRSNLMTMKVCVECGSLFIPKASHIVRCSSQCTKRANNRSADARLNNTNLVDADITLTKLFVRDKGTCWLCGKQCDWEDQAQSDNGIICGNNYPSIDHVLPLSKGGLHSWDNIRLAHRYCNTVKRDKIV